MLIDVVSLKDIEEIYGKDFYVKGSFTDSSSPSKRVAKEFMDDDVPVKVYNQIGPYATVSLDGVINSQFILPSNKIVKKSITSVLERFTPILDKYFPNRWYYEPITGYIYLSYPELTLTNSIGMSHTIYDLVIRVNIDCNTGALLSITGKRYSFTSNELIAGYRHSHLPVLKNGDSFISFCLGASTGFSKLLLSLNKRNTSKEFEIFLIQLEEFLKWESLEGKPHIGMVKIGRPLQADGIGEELSQDKLQEVSLYVLELLTKNNNCIRFIITNTDKFRVFDPSYADWFYNDIERPIIEKFGAEELNCIDWDIQSMQYVTDSDSNNLTLPLKNTYDNDIMRNLGITPRLIQDDVTPSIQVISRLSKCVIKDLVTTVNRFLINGLVKLTDEQRKRISITPQSESNSNTGSGISDSISAQPVS